MVDPPIVADFDLPKRRGGKSYSRKFMNEVKKTQKIGDIGEEVNHGDPWCQSSCLTLYGAKRKRNNVYVPPAFRPKNVYL